MSGLNTNQIDIEIKSLNSLIPEDCFNKFVHIDGKTYDKDFLSRIYVFFTSIFGWFDRKRIFENLRAKIVLIDSLMNTTLLTPDEKEGIKERLKIIEAKMLGLYANIVCGYEVLEFPEGLSYRTDLQQIIQRI